MTLKIDRTPLESLSPDQIGAALQLIGAELIRRGQGKYGNEVYDTGLLVRQLWNRHEKVDTVENKGSINS